MAASFVGVFSSSRKPREKEAARAILLGTPIEAALGSVVSADSASGELLRFVASLARVNSLEASRSAERLSPILDRWTLIRERRAMERKVMEFRGLLVSTVAGIVVGMLSTLAPVISSFQITLAGTQPPSGFSPIVGAAFLVPSAVCLGVYLSPGRPYLNAFVSLLAYAGVVYFLGPLASFSVGG